MFRQLVLCSSAVLIACTGGNVSSVASTPRTSADGGVSQAGGPVLGGPGQPPTYPGPINPPGGATPFYRTTFFANFDLDQTTTHVDGTLVLGQLPHSGTEQPNAFHGFNYYNGGPYIYGTAVSPIHEVASGFTEVVPSFEATTPEGTWVVIKVSARVAGSWTKDYVMGVWSSDTDVVKRHSVDGQDDAAGTVKTDTLVLSQSADALRLTLVLMANAPGRTPVVRAVAATANPTAVEAVGPAPSVPSALGQVLDVPQRHQPDESSCSPTSTSMLLAYWSTLLSDPTLTEDIPTAAAGTFDALYNGDGNWPFNMAHAAALDSGKLHGFITRMGSFAQVERLIAASIPVGISISFDPGGLAGSPLKSTTGHILVVRGFTDKGDVVCNEPAFSTDATVQVTYKRNQLEKAWSHSGRATYVVWPDTITLPHDPLGAY